MTDENSKNLKLIIEPDINGKELNIRQPLKCKKISNYLLIHSIGQGTFGKVMLGQHCPTKLNVAIKILDKSKIIDQRDYDRIDREIAILKKLRHNNIIQLYETIKSKRNIYLIMEYIDGRDLFDYISSKKRLDEATASNFYFQLISAIEYIHKIGVVHRDIKPENILLDKYHETITLVDFGLSNTYNQGTHIKTACGSPCYASPEDDELPKLYEKINKGHFILPNYLSIEAKDLLMNVMNVDPEKRFNIEQIKNHSWLTYRNYKLNEGIMIGKDKIRIERNIIEHSIQILKDEENLNEEKIIKYLEKNYCNHITTTYYLIEKNLREQERRKKRKRINEGKATNELTLSRNIEKNSSNLAVQGVQRSGNNSNNASIIKENANNQNIEGNINSQNVKNEFDLSKKLNDASNNMLKDLEKKNNTISQNNIEKDIENLDHASLSKDKKFIISNDRLIDKESANNPNNANNANNISFAENEKVGLKKNDDLIKNKLINNLNKKNILNNVINNNKFNHYKTVNVVNNKNNLNEISAEIQNYQNTDHSKNIDNSSILNTNSINQTNPNTNTLQQSIPNIQMHNKNQNLREFNLKNNGKFLTEEMNNNLIISNFIQKNPIENKTQPGYSTNENNNSNYQSTLIPINQQQPLVVVINNTILSDNRRDENYTNIKNNLVNENSNSRNTHDLKDKKRNLYQNKNDSNTECSNEKGNYFSHNTENNNIKVNTYINNVSVGRDNPKSYQKTNKISYNMGVFDQPKKITLNMNNNLEDNKNTLLTNYNNFISNKKNKNLSSNNSHVPSGNSKINPSFFNSSLNQSNIINKDQSDYINKMINQNVNKNFKQQKNFENFNNYVLNDSTKNKIFKNHFQERHLQNENNKSNEKKNNYLNNQDATNKILINNNSNNNKFIYEKELFSSNKFSTKQKIQNLSIKLNDNKKDKDTKTINIDLNNKNLIFQKNDLSKGNKVEKIKTNDITSGLNFPNNFNYNKEIKNISINDKLQENQIHKNEKINIQNSKLNLRTTFFSQIKNNENNIKKGNKPQNPNSYLSTLNDKDEKNKNPNKLINTISKISENGYSNNIKHLNNQEVKKSGISNNSINQNLNHIVKTNSYVDKNFSPVKESSQKKNKNVSQEKEPIDNKDKSNLKNFLNSNNKSENINETNFSQIIQSKLDKSKFVFGTKDNANLNSLLKFGLNNNILSTSSKINLKKNILTATTSSKNNYNNTNNFGNSKNSQNYIANTSSNTKITNPNLKNNSVINLNQSKNSILNPREANLNKNVFNNSRNQVSSLNNKFKIGNMNNFSVNNYDSEENHLKLSKDLANNTNTTNNNVFIKNKLKFNRVFNNIQSGVIDLNTPNKNETFENPNSKDSIPNLFMNNKLMKKPNNSINSNQLISNLTNNSNINYYITNQTNNSKINGLKSQYSIESGNSKNKFLTNASNYSSLNQKTLSENTDYSQNTIINNKYANNGIFKSVNTFISNESGIRSESMNHSSVVDSRGNSRSKSKASDKTTSTIFYYNNGYKSDCSEQNFNFNNCNNIIKSGDESESTNSAINLKKFNKNSFNFNELKNKLQIKELDNSTSFHNLSLNKSGNNNTIKEGNSINENLDCKVIDIKDDYDHNSNPSGNFNNMCNTANNKYSFNSIKHYNNNKNSVIELNKEEHIRKNLLIQHRNVEFMRNKINESKMNLNKQYQENVNMNSISKGKLNAENSLTKEKSNFLRYNFKNLKKFAKENSNSKNKLEKHK